MLAVKLVLTADDAFYKASEQGILEQLRSGALLNNTFARTYEKQKVGDGPMSIKCI